MEKAPLEKDGGVFMCMSLQIVRLPLKTKKHVVFLLSHLPQMFVEKNKKMMVSAKKDPWKEWKRQVPPELRGEKQVRHPKCFFSWAGQHFVFGKIGAESTGGSVTGSVLQSSLPPCGEVRWGHHILASDLGPEG